MAPAELARLRLTLPVRLPDFVVRRLSEEPLLGASLELPLGRALESGAGGPPLPPGCLALGSIALGCFDVPRLLQEALDFEPGKSLLAKGYLPLAGCGRRGTTLYLITLGTSADWKEGEVHWAEGTAGARPSPLFTARGERLRLDDVLRVTRTAPAGSLRQRVQKKRPPRLGLGSPARRRARVEAASLTLFPSAESYSPK